MRPAAAASVLVLYIAATTDQELVVLDIGLGTHEDHAHAHVRVLVGHLQTKHVLIKRAFFFNIKSVNAQVSLEARPRMGG